MLDRCPPAPAPAKRRPMFPFLRSSFYHPIILRLSVTYSSYIPTYQIGLSEVALAVSLSVQQLI